MPPGGRRLAGRFVRLELPGKDRILSLAEVQVFDGTENLARKGKAKQSSTAFDGPAKLAIDGNTDGRYQRGQIDDPHRDVGRSLVGGRPQVRAADRPHRRSGTGPTTACTRGSAAFRVVVLDEKRQPVWTQTVAEPPKPSAELALSGAREVTFVGGLRRLCPARFEAANVLDNKDLAKRGWAVGGQAGQAARADARPGEPDRDRAGLEADRHDRADLAVRRAPHRPVPDRGHRRRPRRGVGPDAREHPVASSRRPPTRRTEAQRSELTRYYLSAAAPELKGERERLAELQDQLADMKPGRPCRSSARTPAGESAEDADPAPRQLPRPGRGSDGGDARGVRIRCRERRLATGWRWRAGSSRRRTR